MDEKKLVTLALAADFIGSSCYHPIISDISILSPGDLVLIQFDGKDRLCEVSLCMDVFEDSTNYNSAVDSFLYGECPHKVEAVYHKVTKNGI